jgi:hypothetical protein
MGVKKEFRKSAMKITTKPLIAVIKECQVLFIMKSVL